MVCDLGFHFGFWLLDCVGSFVIRSFVIPLSFDIRIS
jgi:hypothetical protein